MGIAGRVCLRYRTPVVSMEEWPQKVVRSAAS